MERVGYPFSWILHGLICCGAIAHITPRDGLTMYPYPLMRLFLGLIIMQPPLIKDIYKKLRKDQLLRRSEVCLSLSRQIFAEAVLSKLHLHHFAEHQSGCIGDHFIPGNIKLMVFWASKPDSRLPSGRLILVTNLRHQLRPGRIPAWHAALLFLAGCSFKHCRQDCTCASLFMLPNKKLRAGTAAFAVKSTNCEFAIFAAHVEHKFKGLDVQVN